MSDESILNGWIGCGSVVQIIFIALKLIGIMNWTWWWVMSPTIINLIIVVFLFIAIFIVAAINYW